AVRYGMAAAANNDNSTHRMYVLEPDNPNPMGSYAFKGQLTPTPDRWAIDGTVLQWNGQLYFIWSGWPGTTDGQQNLYIAEMSNPWTISGSRTLISTPTHSWERHGLPINEGPQVLMRDGRLHIIYSASGYWTHQYALGRLTYKGSGSLLSASSWTKAPSPVFMQSGEIVGTGHASFTESPDGTQSWIVYHAHHDKNNWQDNRDILIQPFTWFADGTPNFGVPIPKTTPIETPSGTPDPNRAFVAGDYDANGAVNQADRSVLAAQWGETVFPGIGSDGSSNGLVDGSDFLMWQRQLGQTALAVTAVAAASEAPLNAVEGPADGPADGGGASMSPWRLELAGPTAPAAWDADRHEAVDEAMSNWPAADSPQSRQRRVLYEPRSTGGEASSGRVRPAASGRPVDHLYGIDAALAAAGGLADSGVVLYGSRPPHEP
ncbi:MAG: hypothetical protein DCC67_20810, partial [Planctomycetota bacterium]